MVILKDGVRSNMSVIVSVCSPNFCLLMADKRLVEYNYQQNTPTVVSEDFLKITKLNQNVIYGMAGMLFPDEPITSALAGSSALAANSALDNTKAVNSALNYNDISNNSALNYNDISNADVDDIANSVITFLNKRRFTLILPRNYFIGGKKSNGDFCLYTISINSNTYKPIVEMCSFGKNSDAQGIKIALALPLSLTDEQSKYIQILENSVRTSTTIEGLIYSIRNLICSIADRDMTVNKECVGVIIN